MPLKKRWIEALEAHYKEPAETLIPRLLTYHGSLGKLAEEAHVDPASISRWCKDHDIHIKRVWVKEPQP